MKRKLICIALVLSVALTICFQISPEEASASDGMDNLKQYVSGGKLALKWPKIKGASKYKVTVKNYTTGKSVSYTTKKKSYKMKKPSVLKHGGLFACWVTGLSKKDHVKGMAYMDHAIRYCEPTEIFLSHETLTINQGSKRKLHVSYTTSHTDVHSFTEGILGSWSSSNKKVAKVSSKGKVTAVAPGEAVITYRTINGLSGTVTIIVPQTKTAKGSMYINNSWNPAWHGLLGRSSMRKGTANRLNGTLKSDTWVSKYRIDICTSGGKRVARLTKHVGGKSFNLRKISTKIKFKKAPKGINYVKIYATNEYGTCLVHQEEFKVTGKIPYAKRGKKIVAAALSRQDDPYSQWLRGIKDYTDCSYLSLWSYKCVTGKELPATAADQYKYCVEHGKSISKKDLRPGDLIFYGGAFNGRYKGICHVAIYMGNGTIVHADGTKVSVSSWYTNGRTLYYGRPY